MQDRLGTITFQIPKICTKIGEPVMFRAASSTEARYPGALVISDSHERCCQVYNHQYLCQEVEVAEAAMISGAPLEAVSVIEMIDAPSQNARF